MKYCSLICWIYFFISQTCNADIGDTPKQFDGKYGKPYSYDLETGFRLYHFGPYQILVSFKKGIATKLVYVKRKGDKTDFSKQELEKFMKEYGNGKKWNAYTKKGGRTIMWIREDNDILMQIPYDKNINSVGISKANKLQQKFDGTPLLLEEDEIKEPKSKTTLRLIPDRELSKDLYPIWYNYAFELFSRATWSSAVGNREFYNNKVLIPTFESELKARNALIDKWEKEKTKNPKLKDKYLDELLLVDKAGLMREYVWTYLKKPSWKEKPEKLDLKKFTEWEEKNLKNHKVETHGYIKVKKSDNNSIEE